METEEAWTGEGVEGWWWEETGRKEGGKLWSICKINEKEINKIFSKKCGQTEIAYNDMTHSCNNVGRTQNKVHAEDKAQQLRLWCELL